MRLTFLGNIGGSGGGGPISTEQITDATPFTRALIRLADAASVRAMIGAGTSDLQLGSTSNDAKPGSWVPQVDDLQDAGAAGKAVAKAADAATARSAIGAAADSDVVKLTGNQSVAGTKTFSASPVVPTPSADTHAATKKYVDDQVASVPIPTVPAGAAFVVTHDGVSWPARPAAAAGQVAIWVGGTAGDPPPGALPNDIHWPSAS